MRKKSNSSPSHQNSTTSLNSLSKKRTSIPLLKITHSNSSVTIYPSPSPLKKSFSTLTLSSQHPIPSLQCPSPSKTLNSTRLRLLPSLLFHPEGLKIFSEHTLNSTIRKIHSRFSSRETFSKRSTSRKMI